MGGNPIWQGTNHATSSEPWVCAGNSRGLSVGSQVVGLQEPTVEELPYWETINPYLEKIDPEELQEVVHHLCRRLMRSRAFESMRL